MLLTHRLICVLTLIFDGDVGGGLILFTLFLLGKKNRKSIIFGDKKLHGKTFPNLQGGSKELVSPRSYPLRDP